MIPNQWYAVLDAKEIKKNKPVGVLRMSERLVFWRTAANEIVCMRDLCPHRGVALSTGKLVGEHIQCPFHGFEFAADGACMLIPANGRSGPIPKGMKAHTYPAREEHGFIWIWWGDAPELLPEIPFFEGLDASFSYSSIQDHWKTHYSRAIENQLDVLHLPFVHRNSIGSGNQTIVDGPVTELENERIAIWYSNRREDGRPARNPSELSRPNRPPLIQFIFPNLWQNRLGENFRLVIAFVPIDDENTKMYIRAYQNTVRLPLLKPIFNLFSNIGNYYIQWQDRRVVENQRPKLSGLKIGEKLVPGDLPIILYRKRREALQTEANDQN